MSIARAFFNDFRPFIRMLEDPFNGQLSPLRHRGGSFSHPFFRGDSIPLDLTEEGNTYIVEAELPGVKRENIEVNIGDNGQSVTIQGRIHQRSASVPEIKDARGDSAAPVEAEGGSDNSSLSANPSQALTVKAAELPSTEQSFSSSSTFTRRLWLPREVDQSKVSAKLEDGILTLRLPRADDKGSFKVNVE